MKPTILKSPQQVVTAVEEKIHIEELIYKGKTSRTLGEQFTQMPKLKRITLGENSKYTIRHSADYVTNIPNIEEVTLLQDAIFSENLFVGLAQKESFKCLRLHYPGKEQLQILEKLYRDNKLKDFKIVQNATADLKEFQGEGKYIESNMPLPQIFQSEVEWVQFDYYMQTSEETCTNEELNPEQIEHVIKEALIKKEKQSAFEALAHLSRTKLTETARETIIHFVSGFLEFDSMLINTDNASRLDRLLEDHLFEDLMMYIFSQAKELDLLNVSQEYQTYLPYFTNIERLNFVAPYQNDGFPKDAFTADLLPHPEKIHTLILQNVQVENHLDLGTFKKLTGLTLSCMPFISLSLPDQLKEICLEDNERFYQIPESLYENKGLTYFKFSGELIEFTDDFFELKEMKNLFFSFFGNYPFHLSEKIANFTKLESLIINNLPGLTHIPDEILQLKELHTLHLYGKYRDLHPDLLLLPKLWNICLDSSVWTAVPATLNDCKAMYIQVRGLELKRVPMQQMIRLGYEFQFDSDGFRNSDFIEFFLARNGSPLPPHQYKDFFEVLLANPTNHDLSQKEISLLFHVLWLQEEKYMYDFLGKLAFFNPRCQSIVDVDLPEGNKEIVILGYSSMSGQMLQSQLHKIGFQIADEISESTTHVLIAGDPHYDEGVEGRTDLFYCSEPELAALFARHGMNQMLQEQGEAMIPQMEQMLFSPVEMNKNLALEMLKTLGVPKALHLHILALHKCTEEDTIRKNTQDLLRIYCDDKGILQVLDDDRELFVEKDDRLKMIDIFHKLNNQIHWNDPSDESNRGYICIHLVWKISQNAEALVNLMNKVERGEVKKETPYFEKNWIEMQADSDKHLVYV